MSYTNHLGPRGLPAFDAILDVLADHHWHTHQELVDAASQASDLTPKTIDKLIRSGWRARRYTRTTAGKPLRTANAIYRRAGAR